MVERFLNPAITVEQLRNAGFTLSRNPDFKPVVVKHGEDIVALWRPGAQGEGGLLTVLNPDYIGRLLQ